MSMLRAGLTVAVILIGGVAALLGGVMLMSALKTGAMNISYGHGDSAVAETVTLASDSARFWKFVIGLGVAPLAGGLLAARWGWHAINR